MLRRKTKMPELGNSTAIRTPTSKPLTLSPTEKQNLLHLHQTLFGDMDTLDDFGNELLATLLPKMRIPVPIDTFYALMGAWYHVSAELAIVRMKKGKPELLLTERHDRFHHGWHIPGTVIRPGETKLLALERCVQDELNFHLNTQKGSAPEEVAQLELLKGPDVPRGQVFLTLFIYRVHDNWKPKKGKFFLLDKLPTKMIHETKALVFALQKQLEKDAHS